MAAVAVTFARYLRRADRHLPVSEPVVAAGGARAAHGDQLPRRARRAAACRAALMVLKIAGHRRRSSSPGSSSSTPRRPPRAARVAGRRRDCSSPSLAALTPVMFAYGGWQTASFVAGEMRDPRRDLAARPAGRRRRRHRRSTSPSTSSACACSAPAGWRRPRRPPPTVMRLAFGERGATLIAAGIAISTLGFLSQGMLTAPRVYYAMAEDGLFFRRVGVARTRARACRWSPSRCRACWRSSSPSPAPTSRS